MASILCQGTGFRTEYQLSGTLYIGRTPESDIQLPSASVSKRHGLFRQQQDEWIYEDLGSKNGSLVNGQTEMWGPLQEGALIQIGPFDLTFHESTVPVTMTGESPPETAPHAPGPAWASDVTILGVVQDDRDPARVHSVDSTGYKDSRPTRTADDPVALLRRLRAGYTISEAITQTLDLPQVLERVLTALFGIFSSAERAFVLLVDPETHAVTTGASKRRDAADEGEITISRTALTDVLTNRTALLCRDAMQDERLAQARSIMESGIRSLMIAPLLFRDDVYGAIYVDTRDAKAQLSKDDLELLSFAAAQVAGAIANAQLHKKVVAGERLAAVGQTVAGLAHCIKNILQAVKGGTFIIDKGLGARDLDRVAKGWDILKRQNRFMEQLVWDLLNYSKPRPPEYERIDFNALCAEICDASAALSDNVAVLFRPGQSLPQTEVDPKGIRRCLLNLVTNAIDACAQDGGTVTIETRTDDGAMLVVSVHDTGTGMSKEIMDKLFKAFFTTKGSKGTGLGLPTVHKIVEEHNGRLDVRSTPGEGTTFVMNLPLTHPGCAACDEMVTS